MNQKIIQAQLAKKNVVGIAEGEKWTNGKPTGKKAILIFVEKKEPLSSLSIGDAIESEIDGIPTDVVGKTGIISAINLQPRVRVKSLSGNPYVVHDAVIDSTFSAQRMRLRRKPAAKPRYKPKPKPKPIRKSSPSPNQLKPNKAISVNPKTKTRPILGGISCGHPAITAGTIGGIFRDKTGQIVILSNNHVLANVNDASIGDSIYQPGPFDGGGPGDVIGKLKDFQKLYNGTDQDSAIASVSADYKPVINYIGAVAGFKKTYVGDCVKKSGRTTGFTTGRVIAMNGTFVINYGNKNVQVTKCIVTTNMSQGGDSGSLLVDAKNFAVGLLFAGSTQVTIHSDINVVKQRYGLQLV